MPDDDFREQRNDDWGAAWEAHRLHQLTLALDATPAQRLAWLEEVIALAHRAGALPRPRPQGNGADVRYRRIVALRKAEVEGGMKITATVVLAALVLTFVGNVVADEPNARTTIAQTEDVNPKATDTQPPATKYATGIIPFSAIRSRDGTQILVRSDDRTVWYTLWWEGSRLKGKSGDFTVDLEKIR